MATFSNKNGKEKLEFSGLIFPIKRYKRQNSACFIGDITSQILLETYFLFGN